MHFKTKDCPCDPPQQGCVHHQIQITGFELISEECSGQSASDIMKFGTAAVLRKAVDLFNESGNQYSYYRLKQPACWEWDDNILIPCQCQNCDMMECCVTWYKVQRLDTNYYKINDIVYENSSWENCGELIGVTCIGLCSASRVPENYTSPNITPDCGYDCNQSWQYHPIQYVDGSFGNCGFRAFYATRSCSFEEFKIYKILLDQNCGSYYYGIFGAAIRYLLYATEVGYYINRMNKCWRNYGGSALVLCYSDCCWAFYIVSYVDGQLSLAESDSYDTTGYCDNPCENLCGAQNLTLGPLPKKPESEYGWTESNGNAAYVHPNPATEKLEIHFLSEYTGYFRIQGFDAMGSRLLDIPFSKGEAEYILETDVSLYPSGILYYQITRNGYIMIRDKFIVKH